jgi:hypothetical protein
MRHVEVAGDEVVTFARARRLVHPDGTEAPAGRDSGEGGGTLTRYGFGSDAQVTGPGFWAMPSSTPSWNPAAIFAGGRFEAVLQGLRNEHDIVILDTSPLAVVSDAAPLLPLVDGVLLVSRIRQTPTTAVEELKAVLAAVPDTEVIGVVVNDVRARTAQYAYAHTHSRSYGEAP